MHAQIKRRMREVAGANNHAVKGVPIQERALRSAARPLVRGLIKATTNCQARNVVYVIECTKHSIQYIGETENASLTGHQSDIRHSQTF